MRQNDILSYVNIFKRKDERDSFSDEQGGPTPLEINSQRNFKQLDAVYDKNKKRLENFATAPAKSALFTKSRQEHLKSLNKVLASFLDEFTSGIYSKSRKSLLEIDGKILADRDAIEEYTEKLMFAEPGKGDITLLTKAQFRDYTLDSEFHYNERIDFYRSRVDILERSRLEVIDYFRRGMSELYEWNVDTSQAEILLYQANGFSILQAAEVVRIVAAVEVTLAKARKQTKSPEKIQKYYGMAVFTRLLVLIMYEAHIADYNEKWLPSLDRREDRNRKLLLETRALLTAQTTKSGQEQVQRNIKIQENTGKAIVRYKQVLRQRLLRTIEMKTAIAAEVELAVNTFKTLDDAIGFSKERAAFDADYDALANLRPDDLIPLYDEELGDLYIDISQELSRLNS